MTGDDRLRAELRQLEEAAPVQHTPTTMPSPSPSWGRIGLIGTTIVAAVAVTSLALGLGKSLETGSQSSSPDPSGPSAPSNPPVAAETRVGDFILTVASPKTVWATEESIEITAGLVYVGEEPNMTIGQGIPPILFSLANATGDGPTLVGAQLQPCLQYDVSAEEPLVETFRKGLPFTEDGMLEEAAPFDRAFLDDPALRLPPGEWRFTAHTAFDERGCGDDYSLEASIVLQVMTPSPHSPAPSSPVTLDPSPTPLQPEGQVVEIGGIRATLPAGWDVRLPENRPLGAPHIVSS